MNEKIKRMRLRGAVQVRGLWRDLAIFGAVGALACTLAAIRVEGTRLGYELSSLQSAQTELLREQRTLRLELATRRSPHRVEVEARERLGMVEPAPERVVRVGRRSSDAVQVQASR